MSATNGNHMPLLLLFRIAMRHRNLALPHTPLNTLALANYMTTTCQSLKFEQAIDGVAHALNVPVDDLDAAPRTTVRSF